MYGETRRRKILLIRNIKSVRFEILCILKNISIKWYICWLCIISWRLIRWSIHGIIKRKLDIYIIWCFSFYNNKYYLLYFLKILCKYNCLGHTRWYINRKYLWMRNFNYNGWWNSKDIIIQARIFRYYWWRFIRKRKFI